MTTAGSTVAELAARTPATRDRYVDLLRAASIVVVVCGHWLMATVTWARGGIETGNLLAVVPAVRPATWLLQVMPVFFVVGGYANGRSWRSARARGDGYAEWVAHRMRRLLRPLAPFLLGWLIAATLLQALSMRTSAVRTGLLIAVQPLWFVALYVLVIALTPMTTAWHRRWGAGVLVGLAASVGLIDGLRLGAGVTRIGDLNYGFVWVLAHQVGYFYADGRLQRVGRRTLVVAAAVGLASMVALTTLGPYPVSLVGLPGDRISNMAPPSVVVLALTVWLVALVLLLRPAATRVLQRPKAWLAVVRVNAVVLTVFLWHLTALVLVVAAAAGVRAPQPDVATWQWWLVRPLWFALLVAVLAGLVVAAARWETAAIRTAPAVLARVGGVAPAAIGAGYVVVGLAGVARTGLFEPASSRHAAVLHLTLTPVLAVVLLVTGAALVIGAGARPAPWWTRAAPAALALVGAAVLLPTVPGGWPDAATYLASAAVAGLGLRGAGAPGRPAPGA